MKWKGCEKKQSWPILRYYPPLSLLFTHVTVFVLNHTHTNIFYMTWLNFGIFAFFIMETLTMKYKIAIIIEILSVEEKRNELAEIILVSAL